MGEHLTRHKKLVPRCNPRRMSEHELAQCGQKKMIKKVRICEIAFGFLGVKVIAVVIIFQEKLN